MEGVWETMSTFSVTEPQAPHVQAQRKSCESRPPATGPRAYCHEETTGLLVLHLLSGHPEEILPVIDRLERDRKTLGGASELVDLRLLRQLAEQEIARKRIDPEPQGESLTRVALQFGLRILPALRKLATTDGTTVTSKRLRALMVGELAASNPRTFEPAIALSKREHQTLNLVALGLTNYEISHRMGIREGTVKKHLSNVFDKLEATNRTQAVDRARQHGIL